MKIPNLYFALFTAGFLTVGMGARAADQPTLKDAYKGDFYVGVAINRTVATGRAGERMARSNEQIKKDTALVLKQYNQIVAENDMKWASLHPREGANGYDFSAADAFVNFGVRNHMVLVGHTLVWHGQTPFWVFAGTNSSSATPTPTAPTAMPSASPAGANPWDARRAGGGPGNFGRFRYTGPRCSRDELLARMREHIYTVVGRYKGKIKVWDVVNEAISDGDGPDILRNSLWREIIGPDFIAKAFEYAHEADPDAILRYNDYGLEHPAKRKKLIALIKSLQAQKVPVMAIGSQTHVTVTWPTYQEMDETLTDLASLGLPIHITELDVNTAQSGQRTTGADISQNAATTQGGLVEDADKRLAEQYANLFQLFLKHKDSVKMVTLWGVNDAVSWRANGKPLLFDANDEPKPAFNAVIRAATGGNQPKPF